MQALDARRLRWLATAAMREELLRVLDYPHIARRLAFRSIEAAVVLARFDANVAVAPEAPPAGVTCKDPDDQKFIDLAVAHRALLVSKDRQVLKMRSRMLRLGCPAVTAMYAG
jgi:predicted nucleic acid-binding protein